MRISPSSPPPGARPARPVPAPAPERAELPSQPEPSEGRLRRFVAGAALAVVGVGAVAGAAIHVGATAPVCSPSVEGFCVSPSVGNAAMTAQRALRSPLYLEGSVTDLTSGRSREVAPVDGAPPPQELMASGELRVVSWNVHHGTSPEVEGSRDQLAEQIARLRERPADVYLLQEVASWHVDDLVEGLGMPGYYLATNPAGGSLMLVHPSLEVTGNHAAVLSHDFDPGDRGQARRVLLEWMTRGGARSPRAAQLVEVTLPDGRSVGLWNAHLAGSHDPSQALAQVEGLVDFLADEGPPTLIGGGDLNARAGSESLERLDEAGFTASGATIDWLTARGASVSTSARVERDGDGGSLSDHPMLVGEFLVAGG